MPIKKTTEEFIQQSKEIHGDKYDYSKVQYTGCNNKVTIICKKCGNSIEQLPGRHIICRAPRHRCLPQANTEPYVLKAREIHGDKYDYSKVPSKIRRIDGIKNKITIICPEHGPFLQQLSHHSKGSGCKKCYYKKGGIKRRHTIGEFINKSIQCHGDKYDYSKVQYTTSNTKVTIICKKCGNNEFLQRPSAHLLNDGGCPLCFRAKNADAKRKPLEQFIEEAVAIHGDKYDYSKVSYTNNKDKINIICNKHGYFKQTPNKHLSKRQGCYKCFRAKPSPKRKPLEQFIEEAVAIHGDKYDYSKVSYTNSKDKINIICNKHGYFKQTPNQHLSLGRGGCVMCVIFDSNEQRKNTFIKKAEKIHGDRYDYSQINYLNMNTKINIKCKKHGTFSCKPDSHTYIPANRRAQGCYKCLFCPGCELWRTGGELCGYCDPNSKKGKQFREKTKEMEIVKYLRNELPDNPFYHNESVGSDCTKDDRENTNGHLYPDVRFDCDTFQLIVEIDEFRHRGSEYKCDERRMYDIIAKLGMRCVFIRYNPDSAETNKTILLKLVKKYLQYPKMEFNSFGLKTEYLFY